MAKEVKYLITVDAKGAITAQKQVSSGFENVDKSADKAAKATKGQTKTTKESAEAQTALSNALNATPFGRYIQAIQGGIKSTKAMITSSKALRISLMALPFVAIAAAVITLFQAFRSTQEGSDRLNAAIAPLRAVMERLWGMVQNLALSLVGLFKDPIGSIKEFAQILQDFVMRRISDLLSGIGGLGRAINHLFKGEWKAAASEAGKAVTDLTTGLVPIAGLIKDGSDNMKEFNNELREAAETGRRIFEIEREIEQLRIDQTVPMAKMRQEYENLRTAAGDTLLTEQERLKAADEALALLQQIEDEEKKVLDLEIERLQLKQSLNDTSREEELELQKLIARYDELTANTERQARRITRQRSSIVKSIQDQVDKEEQANIAFIEGLEERANAYRDLLLTEEELREQAIEAEIEQINQLVEHEILTREEANEIIAELRRDAQEEELEEKQVHADSLLAIEENLREQERLFMEAATDEERAAIAERLSEFQKLRDQKRAILNKMADDEEDTQAAIRASINRTMGQAIAAGIARANSAKEFGQEVIRVIAREAGAAAARAVFASVPWPSSLFLAPIAGALAERAVMSFANFNTGGLVGDRFGVRGNFGQGDNRLIAARDDEVILNANQQRAIGAGTLARAGVPGFQNVQLDASGFSEAVEKMPKSIVVELDLVDTTRKINDQNDINKRREISVR